MILTLRTATTGWNKSSELDIGRMIPDFRPYVKYLYAVVLFSELRAYIGLRLPEFCVILYRLETRLRTARNLINTDES